MFLTLGVPVIFLGRPFVILIVLMVVEKNWPPGFRHVGRPHISHIPLWEFCRLIFKSAKCPKSTIKINGLCVLGGSEKSGSCCLVFYDSTAPTERRIPEGESQKEILTGLCQEPFHTPCTPLRRNQLQMDCTNWFELFLDFIGLSTTSKKGRCNGNKILPRLHNGRQS